MHGCITALAVVLTLTASCTGGAQDRQQENPETIIASGQVKEVLLV